MRPPLRIRRAPAAVTVTDAKRPKSEDIAYRQRRYLISMGVRTVAFLLAVFLFHGVWRFVAAGLALVVPYFAVVFANGGREPEDAARFESFQPRLSEDQQRTVTPAGLPGPAAGDPGHYSAGQGRPRDGGPGQNAAAGSGPGQRGPGQGDAGRNGSGRDGKSFLSHRQAHRG